MKKNDLEIEKYLIDYLVKTIKDQNLSSLELTRTLADKHRLKIKIKNTESSSPPTENRAVKVDESSTHREERNVKEIVQKYKSGLIVDLNSTFDFDKVFSHEFEQTNIVNGARDYFSLQMGIKKYEMIYNQIN